jgi:hypothetical protein
MKGKRSIHTFPGVRGQYVTLSAFKKLEAHSRRVEAKSSTWKYKYKAEVNSLKAELRKMRSSGKGETT